MLTLLQQFCVVTSDGRAMVSPGRSEVVSFSANKVKKHKGGGGENPHHLLEMSCLQTPEVLMLDSRCCSYRNTSLEQHIAKCGLSRLSST